MYKIFNLFTLIITYFDSIFLPIIKDIYVYKNNKYEKISYLNLYFFYYFNFLTKYFNNLDYKYIVNYKINNNYNYKFFDKTKLYNILKYDFIKNHKLKLIKPIKSVLMTFNNDIIIIIDNVIKYFYKFDDNTKIKEILLFLDYNTNNIKYIDVQLMRKNKRITNIDNFVCKDIFK